MKKEVLYYFTPSELASQLLEELMRMNESGDYLGFTYPDDNTHSCFNLDQETKFKLVLDPYTGSGLKFEKAEYYRGNLSGEDFDLPTFRQPIIQWCPSLIIDASYRKVFNKTEPWGLTMDGMIAISRALRDIFSREVLGAEQIGADISGRFDLYRIAEEGVGVPLDQDFSEKPMFINAHSVPSSRDIWKCENGVILCSQRLGKLLNKFWDGLPDVKFQPIKCIDFPNSTIKELASPLAVKRNRKGLLQDVRSIESAIGMKFPKEYVEFLEEHPTVLPNGWLSINGGLKSVLIQVMKQERDEAEPQMPSELVPIFTYGNGDYVCFQKRPDGSGIKLVDWLHEEGIVKELSLENGFETLKERL